MKPEFILCIHASAIKTPENIGDRIMMHRVDNAIQPLPNQLMMIGQREMLENSPAFRQILPYTIFMKDGQVLCMQRTSKGGESKLHGKKSIGLGGHIDAPDIVYDFNGALDQPATYLRTVARELAEELTYDGQPVSLGSARPEFTHFLIGNKGVNQVHLGMLNIVHLGDQIDGSKFGTKDAGLTCLGMKDPAELVDDELMEDWSAEVLRYIVQQTVETIKAGAVAEIAEFETVEGEVA
jgi:predicted NUDIX family phosphoesterase